MHDLATRRRSIGWVLALCSRSKSTLITAVRVVEMLDALHCRGEDLSYLQCVACFWIVAKIEEEAVEFRAYTFARFGDVEPNALLAAEKRVLTALECNVPCRLATLYSKELPELFALVLILCTIPTTATNVNWRRLVDECHRELYRDQSHVCFDSTLPLLDIWYARARSEVDPSPVKKKP